MAGEHKFGREGPRLRIDRVVDKFRGPAMAKERESIRKEADEKKRKLIEQMKQRKTT